LEVVDRVLASEPDNARALKTAAYLQQSLGNLDRATELAQRYVDRRPDDVNGYVALGDLLRDRGERAAAEAHYQEANLRGNGLVTPLLRLAELAARDGDPARAWGYTEQAAQVANSPQQHSLVLGEQARQRYRQGRLREALALMQRKRGYESEFNSLIEMVFSIDMHLLGMHLQLGDIEAGAAILDGAEPQLEAPYDDFLELGWAFVHHARGDLDAAAASLDTARRMLRQYRVDHVMHQHDFARALLAETLGDDEAAARWYRESIDHLQGSIAAGAMSGLLPELYGRLADVLVALGDWDAADDAIDAGFQLDEGCASLWASRARLQDARGQQALARASMGYAMAIWEHADSSFDLYRDAEALAARLMPGALAATGPR
jgi:tetratricopeptide (TPR) repeat protein